jgi:hypothetical protein
MNQWCLWTVLSERRHTSTNRKSILPGESGTGRLYRAWSHVHKKDGQRLRLCSALYSFFPGSPKLLWQRCTLYPWGTSQQINRRVRVLSAPSWWWSYRLTRPRAGKAEPYPAPLGLLASHLAEGRCKSQRWIDKGPTWVKKMDFTPEVEKFGGSDYKFLGVFKTWNDPNFGGLAPAQRDPLTHDHWHRSCNPLFIGPS